MYLDPSAMIIATRSQRRTLDYARLDGTCEPESGRRVRPWRQRANTRRHDETR
jgi:hypothetical protein